MSDHSFAQSVGKLLLDNTIARDMKGFTVVRKSLFAEVNYDLNLVKHGGAVDVSLVLMLWEDISDLKLVECVSNHCWMRKPPSDETSR